MATIGTNSVEWEFGWVGSEAVEIAHIDYFEMFDYEDEARNRVLARERYCGPGSDFSFKVNRSYDAQ